MIKTTLETEIRSEYFAPECEAVASQPQGIICSSPDIPDGDYDPDNDLGDI